MVNVPIKIVSLSHAWHNVRDVRQQKNRHRGYLLVTMSLLDYSNRPRYSLHFSPTTVATCHTYIVVVLHPRPRSQLGVYAVCLSVVGSARIPTNHRGPLCDRPVPRPAMIYQCLQGIRSGSRKTPEPCFLPRFCTVVSPGSAILSTDFSGGSAKMLTDDGPATPAPLVRPTSVHKTKGNAWRINFSSISSHWRLLDCCLGLWKILTGSILGGPHAII